VTDGRVPDTGRVWQELSDLAAETGLLPVLSDLGAESFMYHGDVAAVSHSSRNQVDSVAEIASLIIDQPIWGFWWD